MVDAEVEKEYQEFWKEIIEKPDGSIDKEQLKKELFDFSQLMINASKVYCYITGDAISKVNTDPDAVIRCADDYNERTRAFLCADCDFKGVDSGKV